MDIETAQQFLGWFTLIHIAIYFYSVVVASFAKDWLYRNKAERFGFQINREVFAAILFSMLGIYKLLIIFFGLVPWLSLSTPPPN